jgi:hypothetical protein
MISPYYWHASDTHSKEFNPPGYTAGLAAPGTVYYSAIAIGKDLELDQWKRVAVETLAQEVCRNGEEQLEELGLPVVPIYRLQNGFLYDRIHPLVKFRKVDRVEEGGERRPGVAPGFVVIGIEHGLGE